MKGIICRNLYPKPDYRQSGDEDVLIPAEQFDLCHQVMVDFGMYTTEGGYVMYPNHQGKYDAYGIVGVHEKPCSVVMDREKAYFVLIDEIIRTLGGKHVDINNPRQRIEEINCA